MKSTNKCNLGSLNTLFTLSFSSNDMDFIHYKRGDTDLKVPTFLTTFCFLFFSLLLEYYWLIEKVQQSLHGYHCMQKLVSACTQQCSKDCRETWIRHSYTQRDILLIVIFGKTHIIRTIMCDTPTLLRHGFYISLYLCMKLG